MASYQRATKLAAAPVGAGFVITSTFFGQKTSTCSINRFSSAAAKTLQRTPHCTHTYARSNQVFPRINSVSNGQHRPLSTSLKVESSSLKERTSSNLVQWYESHLKANPVSTKMVTGSFLWGLGDFVAQVVPTLLLDDKDSSTLITTVGENSKAIVKDNAFAYDYPRTARAVLFGFALHAPLSHMHFNFLEWMTIRGGFAGLSIPIFKTAMEQFVYWSWISNSLYHASMGAMQGMAPNQIYDRISNVLMDTQKAQWAFWIPVQLVNFRFVPVRHQLNVVLVVSVVWTALLSAWYPPEDEKGDEDVVSTVGVIEADLEKRSAKTASS